MVGVSTDVDIWLNEGLGTRPVRMFRWVKLAVPESSCSDPLPRSTCQLTDQPKQHPTAASAANKKCCPDGPGSTPHRGLSGDLGWATRVPKGRASAATTPDRQVGGGAAVAERSAPALRPSDSSRAARGSLRRGSCCVVPVAPHPTRLSTGTPLRCARRGLVCRSVASSVGWGGVCRSLGGLACPACRSTRSSPRG